MFGCLQYRESSLIGRTCHHTTITDQCLKIITHTHTHPRCALHGGVRAHAGSARPWCLRGDHETRSVWTHACPPPPRALAFSIVDCDDHQHSVIHPALTHTPPTHTVSIPQLVADHGLDEGVLEETLNQLLKTHQLPGTLRGREFVPAAFSRTQRACVDAFFAQNGYLEHTRAQRLKVSGRVCIGCTGLAIDR
jgi:hypothetical protein